MKILHLNKTDVTEGAGRAAYRIHQALQKINVSSKVLCQNRNIDDKDVIGPQTPIGKALAVFRGFLDRWVISFYPNRPSTLFYPQWLPESVLSSIDKLDPDIVHLHWICGGFVQIETISKIKRPLVWTLHDMWPFTGGCHYSGACENYTIHCGSCPQLGSQKDRDLSHWVWRRKKRGFRLKKPAVVAPSRWLAACAAKSSLMRDMQIHVISNGIDLKKYYPIDQKFGRKFFNLPPDKRLILIAHKGAETEIRKGWEYLNTALAWLAKAPDSEKFEIVVLGCTEPESPPDHAIKIHYLGRLFDDLTLASLYSACDCFVLSSTQDNLPNMVMEAMACGTPCIAFDVGGLSDMIDHRHNGYLARPFDTSDLAAGIVWVLNEDRRRQKLSLMAREKVEKKFDSLSIAGQYLALYQEIYNNR